VALVVFIVLAGAGIPAIWILVEPKYTVTRLINVAPTQQDLLTGEPERGDIGSYESFVNTQALAITQPQVIERVLDDLLPRNLAFFTGQKSGRFAGLKMRIRAPLHPRIDSDRP
jgi:uncharacterized protein involved in exopolysaccharide biosynthesis